MGLVLAFSSGIFFRWLWWGGAATAFFSSASRFFFFPNPSIDGVYLTWFKKSKGA